MTTNCFEDRVRDLARLACTTKDEPVVGDPDSGVGSLRAPLLIAGVPVHEVDAWVRAAESIPVPRLPHRYRAQAVVREVVAFRLAGFIAEDAGPWLSTRRTCTHQVARAHHDQGWSGYMWACVDKAFPHTPLDAEQTTARMAFVNSGLSPAVALSYLLAGVEPARGFRNVGAAPGHGPCRLGDHDPDVGCAALTSPAPTLVGTDRADTGCRACAGTPMRRYDTLIGVPALLRTGMLLGRAPDMTQFEDTAVEMAEETEFVVEVLNGLG